MKIMKCQQENILKDLNSKGKIRNWRGKKMSSLHIAKIYKHIGKGQTRELKTLKVNGETVETRKNGLYVNDKRIVNYEKRAENMKFCGSFLNFKKVDTKLKLVKANFCRVPLCPMCQWRKSLRVFFDTSRIVDELEKRHKTLKPIFLTLTVKNCSLENLGQILDDIFKGWDILMRSNTLNPMVKGEITHIIKGWFRALEVEYNSETNEFHPHFHTILYVDKNYFKSKDYLSTAEWVQIWRRSAKLDYDPVCDIRKVKNTKSRKSIMEVAKYTYKDTEILTETLSDDTKVEVVKNLSAALHQRRLYAYGGAMKTIAAELKIKDIDKSDLINVDDDKINTSIVKAILHYRWNMGISNYVLKQELSEEIEVNQQTIKIEKSDRKNV
jgi:plasmid rolling circle replication initiator protein Rep